MLPVTCPRLLTIPIDKAAALSVDYFSQKTCDLERYLFAVVAAVAAASHQQEDQA